MAGAIWSIRASLLVLLAALAGCGGTVAEPHPDPFQVRVLLLARDYDTLERLLASSRPEHELEALYGSFATTDPALAEPLDAWVSTRKESAIPPLARAHYNEWREYILKHSEGVRWWSKLRTDSVLTGNGQIGPDATAAINRDGAQSLALRIMVSTDGPSTDIVTWHAALRAAPTSVAVRRAYLIDYLPWNSDTFEEIEPFLNNHVRSVPNQSEMRQLYGYSDFARAGALFFDDHLNDALSAIDSALSFGDAFEFHNLRALINWQLGRHQEALTDFDQVLLLAPYQSEVLDLRAQLLYWVIMDSDAAYADWDLALRVDPLNPKILMNRADALYKDERYNEAMADLNAALAFNFSDPRLHHKRAQAFIHGLEDYRRTLEETRLSLSVPAKHNPVWAETWYLHGFALDKLADCKAVPAFETYLELCTAGAECGEEPLSHARDRLAAMGSDCPAE